MSRELVSVVITTHNRVDLLSRALKSVLNQSYPVIEIIIVNDGSTDGTVELLRKYKNKHKTLKTISYNKPKGACFARNKGILESTGKYVIGLDDDDEFHKDRVKILMEHNSDEYAFCASLSKRIRGKYTYITKTKKIVSYDDFKWKNLGTSFPLIEKSKFLKVGLFDENLPASQDYDMWFRLLKEYNFGVVVQKPLYILYDEDIERISLGSGKIKGRKMFYEKHKGELSLRQRRYHKYYLSKLMKQPVSVFDWIRSVPPRFYQSEGKYLLQSIYSKYFN